MLVPNRFQIPQVFTEKLQHSAKKYFQFLKYQLKSALGAQWLVQMWSALPFRKALTIPNNFYFSHFALKCSFKPITYQKPFFSVLSWTQGQDCISIVDVEPVLRSKS